MFTEELSFFSVHYHYTFEYQRPWWYQRHNPEHYCCRDKNVRTFYLNLISKNGTFFLWNQYKIKSNRHGSFSIIFVNKWIRWRNYRIFRLQFELDINRAWVIKSISNCKGCHKMQRILEMIIQYPIWELCACRMLVLEFICVAVDDTLKLHVKKTTLQLVWLLIWDSFYDFRAIHE